LGVTRKGGRKGSFFKIQTADGVKGYIPFGNVLNATDYLFHEEGFWDRMMEFSLSTKKRPLVPGRYRSSKGDFYLVLDKAKDSKFYVRIPDKSKDAFDCKRFGKTNLLAVRGFKLTKNDPPIELNGGRYYYTFRLNFDEDEKTDPKYVPYLHYFVGDYIITSSTSFVKDGIEFKLVRQKDNSFFR